MRALVVFEPFAVLGGPIALAIAEGLGQAGGQSTAVEVGRAADVVPASVDLLVVGVPARTRLPAVIGGDLAPVQTVRQWLSYAAPARPGTAAAAYDLRGRGPGDVVVRLDSTAVPTEKALRRAGFRTIEHAEHFVCPADPASALAHAELVRARAWGRRLAAAAAPVHAHRN
jgi:hypothetical protein